MENKKTGIGKVLIYTMLLILMTQLAYAELSTDIWGAWTFNADTGMSPSEGGFTWVNHGSTNGTGKSGNSVNCESTTNDWIDSLNNTLPFGDMTINLWVKNRDDVVGFILDKYDGTSPNKGLKWVQSTPQYDLYFYSSETGVDDNLMLTPNLGGGSWVMLTYVLNESLGQKSYINGVLNQSNFKLLNKASSQVWALCRNQLSASDYYDGEIDDITIWDRALNPDEVLSLYNNNTGLFYPFTMGVTNNVPVVNITNPDNATSHNASFILNWTVVEVENTYLQNITLGNTSGIQLSFLNQPSSVTGVVFDVSGLANGTYTAIVKAFETNGTDLFVGTDSGSYLTANEGTPTGVPNVSPVVNVTAPVNGTSQDASFTFEWSVIETGNTYLQNITLSNASGVQLSSLEQLSSVTTFLFDISNLANGTYIATILAYETNGTDLFTGSDSGSYIVANQGIPVVEGDFCPAGQVNVEDGIFGGSASAPILLVITILLVGVGFTTLNKGGGF